uniref:F-box domain-containing protein n=1 Tax=Meloidogyne hapla TaxID=6305 RepID=A0A1I8BKF3_MELHA
MFNNLQVESKLDIFKYLNIEQLTSFRQTNRYFNALIGRYEGELARKELDSIEIIEFYHGIYYKSINLQDGLFELKITDQLMEKHIESSKDYSNMFNYIRFSNCSWPSFNLNERAEFIERRPGFSHYQLTNMHNPKIKFSIFYEERNGLIFNFNIARVNQ